MKSCLASLLLTVDASACNVAAFLSPKKGHQRFVHSSTGPLILKQVYNRPKQLIIQEITSSIAIAGSREENASSSSAELIDTTTHVKNVDGDDGGTKLPMSKNQIKKRKRYEKLMKKKEQAKERKEAKALAEGRDLEAERRLQAEKEKSGEGKKKRDKRLKKRMETANTTFKVCIDCGFEDLMTTKEISSLANQVQYCYAGNKRSENPVYLSASNLGDSSVTFEHLAKVNGFPDQWKSRGFSCSVEPLDKMHDKESLVYLTSDATTTLDHLDDSKTYVIGGIVDRNRLKRTTIQKAENVGIMTARLPIDDHLKLVATKVLTVNHVFEILLKYRQYGNDWKKSLLDVLPQRKGITEVEFSKDEYDEIKSEGNEWTSSVVVE